MQYWFLYHLQDGSIYGTPYRGSVEEWTNIPPGCAVLGPLPEEDEAATDAFMYPNNYTVIDGELSKTGDTYPEPVPAAPTPDEIIADLNQQVLTTQAALADVYETMLTLQAELAAMKGGQSA
ncbi:hypothetical protein [Paenibacillus sp. y28]|uniref:hypothetical protein n=1 Tax=Paenibacillus sp. y28 TaxID=3129110 RepID=UPI003019EB0A